MMRLGKARLSPSAALLLVHVQHEHVPQLLLSEMGMRAWLDAHLDNGGMNFGCGIP